MVCWNINRSRDAFLELTEMPDVDVALLQEVGRGAAGRIADTSGERVPWNWNRSSTWPAVVRLSDRVRVDLFEPVAAEREGMPANAIAVSDSRTLAAARVTPLHGGIPALESFLVFSMHARWLYPHAQAERARPRGGRAVYAYTDGSAHRIISDLSAFITHTNPSSHRLLAAGDLGTIHGAADTSRMEHPARARTIFDRMQALGLEFMGPQWPDADRQADPLPHGLPKDTRNVPTCLAGQQRRRMLDEDIVSGYQYDYVFASRGFHDRVRVHAMNDAAGFGPSDHCRIRIDVR
jgi:hypothetical protein